MLDFCWLSRLFDFVEHANFEVVYARLEVDFDGFMVESDDHSLVLIFVFFEEFYFSISRFSALVLGSLLEQGSHVNHLFHVACIHLFHPVELDSVRSSDVEVGE